MNHRIKKIAALSLFLIVGLTGAVGAASKTQTTSNGCGVAASNVWYSNDFEASSRSKRVSGTCHTLETNFRYRNGSGAWVLGSSGYVQASDITILKLSTAKPSTSNHNNQASSGATKYGFPLSF